MVGLVNPIYAHMALGVAADAEKLGAKKIVLKSRILRTCDPLYEDTQKLLKTCAAVMREDAGEAGKNSRRKSEARALIRICGRAGGEKQELLDSAERGTAAETQEGGQRERALALYENLGVSIFSETFDALMGTVICGWLAPLGVLRAASGGHAFRKRSMEIRREMREIYEFSGTELWAARRGMMRKIMGLFSGGAEASDGEKKNQMS